MANKESLYLCHHGIMGQQWGKRNGPPYPLSPGAHSSSEKKANWRRSLARDGEISKAKIAYGAKKQKRVTAHTSSEKDKAEFVKKMSETESIKKLFERNPSMHKTMMTNVSRLADFSIDKEIDIKSLINNPAIWNENINDINMQNAHRAMWTAVRNHQTAVQMHQHAQRQSYVQRQSHYF